jgi:hypothetical protein
MNSCVHPNPESTTERSATQGSAWEGAWDWDTELIDPATTRLRGSIMYDWENGFDLEWESIDEFHQWRENEQQAHSIELRLAHTESSQGSMVYTGSRLWVCSCQGMGGDTHYKRTTDCKSRKEHKRLNSGCPCQVKIKTYPHTLTILRKYAPDHLHLTGKDNLKHVRIRVPMWEHVMELIRLGLMDKEIVCDNLSGHYSICNLIYYRKSGSGLSIVNMNGIITSHLRRSATLGKLSCGR